MKPLKRNLILAFLTFLVAIFTWLILLQKPIDPSIDIETEAPKKKSPRQNFTVDQTLQSPIIEQRIPQNYTEDSISDQNIDKIKVKILFTEEFKKTTPEVSTFQIIIYKDHQEIYRAEKKENEYLDLAFKIKENYQFYLFLNNMMSFHQLIIQEPETIIESHPKEKIKKIIVKNDFKNLFADFNIGSFTFDEKYNFIKLQKSELSFNEFCIFPGINFPKNYYFCHMMLSNENGFFTFEKTFEEIYNNEPIEIDLPSLKEISIKILNNEKAIKLDLFFIPEKFIQKQDKEEINLKIIGSESTFFTNVDLCKINLSGENIDLTKFIPLKEALTSVAFDLSTLTLETRKIIIKNNPYGEKLKLFQCLDKKTGSGFLGFRYGIIQPLNLISQDIFEYPINTSDGKVFLFFDIIETTPADNENNNLSEIKQSRIGYLGVDFFKGSLEKSIEIDFGKFQYYKVTLKTNNLEVEPLFLISLNEQYVINLTEHDNKKEIQLLLKKGIYRAFFGDKDEDNNQNILFSQNFEIYADASFNLLNEYNNIISPDENADDENDEEIEGYYLSFKNHIPTRLNLFQILKNLNCVIEIKPENKYKKLDNTYIMMGNKGETDDDNEIILSKLKENQFNTKELKNIPIIKYTEPKIDSNFFHGSEIIFLKSFAPNHSETQIINLMQNFLLKDFSFKRRGDDNAKAHLFLNNFKYIILPPLNKPTDKTLTGFYGIVKFRFSNPQHQLFAFEILDENDQIQNSNHSDFAIFDTHSIYTDNTTNGSSFEFNFLEFGTHKLQVSNLSTGITYNFSFQVTEKYQEIEVK